MKIELNKTESKLLWYVLDRASDEFGNFGCNDVDEDFIDQLDKDELISIDLKIHTLNGDPEEHDPEALFSATNDSILMWYFSKLVKQKEEQNEPTE